MIEIPTTGGFAEYRGQRYRIVFSGDDWVALRVEPGVELPDGFAAGDAPRGRGHYEPWVKVPRSALDRLLHIRVKAKLSGHVVSVQYQFPDGQVRLEFIGPPAIARELGLHGDQYMGWTGLVTPDRLTDIEVQETRRA